MANLLTEICSDVRIDRSATPNYMPARLDIAFRYERTFFDVRVFNPLLTLATCIVQCIRGQKLCAWSQ